MPRKYYHADPPGQRSLEPLTEQDIIRILKNQDMVREVSPNLAEYAVFLADLHTIFVGEGQMEGIVEEGIIPAFVNSVQAVQILNLRAVRENIMHKGFPQTYDESIMRQYKTRGIISPLSPAEQLKKFGFVMTKRHVWRLEDVLKTPLGRWPQTVPSGSWHTSRDKFHHIFGQSMAAAASAS